MVPSRDEEADAHQSDGTRHHQSEPEEISSACYSTGMVVQVPKDGWYALCFGFDGAAAAAENNQASSLQQKKASSAGTTTKSKAGGSSSPAAGSYSLTIRQQQDLAPSAESDDESIVSINLPLQNKPGGQFLQNLNVGKLMYLTRGAKLTVSPVVSSAAITPSPAEEGEQQQVGAERSPHQWCVLHHHSPAEGDGNTAGAKVESPHQKEPPTPALGTLSDHKKSVVCRHCVRSFPSVRAVENHIEVVHDRASCHKRKRGDTNNSDSDNDDDSSVWTRPLHVVYQDAYMAVIDKPQGMAVQGAKPSLLRSDLLLALALSAPPSKGKPGETVDPSSGSNHSLLNPGDAALSKPRPAHRLDAATGGLLVLAKTKQSESALKQSFARRECHKRYRALVVGKVADLRLSSTSENEDGDNGNTKVSTIISEKDGQLLGVVDVPIGGKESRTLFRPVRHVRSAKEGEEEWLTLLDLWPVTGRRHQLRRHMKEIGHHIVGDTRYCGKSQNSRRDDDDDDEESSSSAKADSKLPTNGSRSRLCLWAMEITLPHPHSGEQRTFSLSKDPEWLEQVIRLEAEAWKERQTGMKGNSNA